MAERKNLDKPNGFDSLSPFGQNNDLKFRMMVESSQESYNSEVVDGSNTKKPSTYGKSPKIKTRRDG